MAAPKDYRFLVRWGGRAIVVVALIFLAWKAREHWAVLSTWSPTPRTAGLLFACSVAYGVGMMFIGESWHQILSGVAEGRLSRFVTWPSFGVTQVAKYLPGNVFHYVGRHVWLKQQGVTHRAALTATAWEVVLMASTALGVAALLLMFWPIEIASLPAATVSLAASAVAAVLLLVLILVQVAGRRISRLQPFVPAQTALVLSPFALLGFFGLQGTVFYLLFHAVDATPVVAVAAIANLAWLVGYATPGAPGGIGSREALLVAMITPLAGPSNALILAALFRLVTTLGDFVCFALSSLVARAAPAERATAA
ncbi:lysylphosphatidylglycerol synthase domain-containing protein [Phenylobacterium kunshanense]|uniref:Uncharacterized protein n=1 Tax=Phenylobacterium kunshanense TaxID=1445034 RepID=A0A328BIL9_9CAUL|nr:lysylphosphatidylglycerol synthase domain-containing protein [Phenylobacterium kunshanense]RAK66505.1 hypothetical protein DJ019_09700 [Phenylobacterium kunshanense]